MTLINNPILTALVTAGFIALAYASMHREVGYTHSIFNVLPQTKQQHQADVLMEVWDIKKDEIDKPIKIFTKE